MLARRCRAPGPRATPPRPWSSCGQTWAGSRGSSTTRPARRGRRSREAFAQQVLRDPQPIVGRGPHVVDRREILRQRLRGRLDASLRRPGLAGQRRLGRPARASASPPCRRTRCGRPRRGRPSSADRKAAQHGGDVLVEALGDLVAAEPRAGRGLGGRGRSRRTRPAGGPACRRRGRSPRAAACARSLAAAQHQRGAERDQRRRHVADRRAVGDVAADRARVADLHASRGGGSARRGRGCRPRRARLRVGIASRPRRSRARRRRLLDAAAARRRRPMQITVAEIARCCLVTHSPTSVRAGEHRRVGMLEQQAGQLVERRAARRSGARRCRREMSSPSSRSRSARRASASRSASRSPAPAHACRCAASTIGPIAGAAAEIAGERVVDALASSARRAARCAERDRATSRSPACRSRIASRGASTIACCTGCSAAVGRCRSSTVSSCAAVEHRQRRGCRH